MRSSFIYEIRPNTLTKWVDLPNLGISLKYIRNKDNLITLQLGDYQITLGDPTIPEQCISFPGTTSYCFKTLEADLNDNITFSATAIKAFPTGDSTVDSVIMAFLPVEELRGFCQSSKYLSSICDNGEFWRQRLSKQQGLSLPLYNKSQVDYTKMGKLTLSMDWSLSETAFYLGYSHLLAFLEEHGFESPRDYNNLLLSAVKKGRLEMVKELVYRGADVDYHSGVALKYALENGDLEMIKYLRRRAVTLGSRRSMLALAAASCNSDVLDYFLKDEGILPNIADADRMLNAAVETQCLNTVSYILDQKIASLAEIQRGLSTAASLGNVEIVKTFLDHVNYIDANQGSALRAAAREGHLDVVALLLDRGANESFLEDMPLSPAIVYLLKNRKL